MKDESAFTVSRGSDGGSARASINSTHGQPLYRFLLTKNRLCAGFSAAEIRARPFGVCTSLHELGGSAGPRCRQTQKFAHAFSL